MLGLTLTDLIAGLAVALGAAPRPFMGSLTGSKAMGAGWLRLLGVAGFGRGLLLAVSVLFLVGVLAACDHQPTPADNQQPSMKTVVIPVEGMSCVACAARVKKTLTSIAGVGDVQVSLTERNARVRFDPSRLGAERLVTAINGLGYHAGTPAEGQ